MKKLFFVLCSMLLLTSFTLPMYDDGDDPEDIPLTSERIKDSHLGDPMPKNPIQAPSASHIGNTFYINGDHPDYVLQLVDMTDGTTVVYQINMPAGVNSTILPSTYSGTYIIQLLWSDWRFWGYVEL